MTIFHALHGIGSVVEIEEKEILETKVKFAVVQFENMRVMVNVAQLEEHMRVPIESSEAEKVLDAVTEDSWKMPSNHNHRHKSALDKLKKGDPYELAAIVRGFSQLSLKRRLANRDQRTLDHALDLLSEELAFSLAEDTQAMREKLFHLATDELAPVAI